jgi:hypothetical protein
MYGCDDRRGVIPDMKKALASILFAVLLVPGTGRAEGTRAHKAFLVVTFDVEDYISPEAERIDDIPGWLAEIMTEEGVTGTFFVIGEKARSLEKRGRHDVIAAMARHDIGSHTNFGSLHPTIAEELEKADWNAGVRKMRIQESAGIRDLARIFGVPIRILARHGGSYGPQLVCALGRMKVAYQGSPARLPGRDVVWFSNALNFSAQYSGFDDAYWRDDLFGLVFDKFKADLSGLARTSEVLALFAGHPTKIRAEEFWDLNFYGGKNTPPSEWRAPRLRPAEAMTAAQANFRRLMRYIKGRDDIEITTYRKLVDLYARQEEYVGADELAGMASDTLGTKALAPSERFSPAEAFAGLAKSIVAFAKPGILPSSVKMGHPLGPQRMPPEQPGVERVTLEDVFRLAGEAVDIVNRTGALPAWLSVGTARLGTGSLFALFSAVYLDLGAKKQLREYEVPAFEPYPRTNETPIIKEVEGYKSWPVHRPDLDMSKIVELTRLQLWTLKPATCGSSDRSGGADRGP